MKRSGKKAGSAGEIDAIKAFIWIMAVLTAALAVISFFFLSPRLDELEKANARAKRSSAQIIQLRNEIGRYLSAYEKTKEQGGIGSPEEYFARVREVSGVSKEQVTSFQPNRESGKSTAYKELYCAITLNQVTWDQLVKYMWYAEHQSPKYRILAIDDLKRVEQKSAEDQWKVSLKAAYRTQMER